MLKYMNAKIMLNINSDLWGTWSQYLIIQTKNGEIEKEELLIILLKRT